MLNNKLCKPSTVILLFVLLLSSCTPQMRLQHLIKKHPELKTIDTLKLVDTVIVPGVRVDTVFKLHYINDSIHDTIIIKKDRLEASIIINGNKAQFTGECKPDTILKPLAIPYERIKVVETKKNEVWMYFVLVLEAFIILYLAGRAIFKN
ncbi:MAG: hypothetical protein WCQ95_01535 [Bacteroidota bacterium]